MKGFGCRPQHERTGRRRGRRPKASQGRNRGQDAAAFAAGSLWGFERSGRFKTVLVSITGAEI
jgi:hypothetical protein